MKSQQGLPAVTRRNWGTRRSVRTFYFPSSVKGGFTRAEAFALVFAVALLSMICLPMAASSSARTEQAICLNNLRLIGQALHVWGRDHGDRLPWRTPEEEGGTMPSIGTKPAEIWREIMSLTNELVSPVVLSCPSDSRVRVATKWTDDQDCGFFNPRFRTQAVSYFVGLDVFPEFASYPLAGDRNLRVDYSFAQCSSRIFGVQGISSDFRFGFGVAGWTNGLHETKGNILFNDGRVKMTSPSEFSQIWFVNEDNGVAHILLPR